MRLPQSLLAIVIAVGSVGPVWAQYIIETKGKYYHRMNCGLLRNMPKDEWLFVRTARAASLYHKHPCPHCKPPVEGRPAKSITLPMSINMVADMRKRVYHRVNCPLVKGIRKEDGLLLRSVKEVRECRCRQCSECKPFSWRELEEFNKKDAAGFESKDLSANLPDLVVPATLEVVKTVLVPGNTPSVNTNIRIQKGQIVLFSASGRIQTHFRAKAGEPPPIWGPEGKLEDGKRKYCLVAAVGDEVHVIGRKHGVRFKQSGLLHVGFRDEIKGYEDNQGAFSVRINVLTPEGKPEKPDKK